MLTRRAGVLSALLLLCLIELKRKPVNSPEPTPSGSARRDAPSRIPPAAEVKGYLVLGNHPLDLRGLPTRIREYLYSRSSDLMEDEMANACFSLARQTREITMLAGAIPVGLTTWRVQRDTIRAFLYGSPDASYLLRLGVGTAAMHGRGHESGFIGSWFSNDAGNTVAVRISTVVFRREDDGEWKIFYEQKQISRLPLER